MMTRAGNYTSFKERFIKVVLYFGKIFSLQIKRIQSLEITELIFLSIENPHRIQKLSLLFISTIV